MKFLFPWVGGLDPGTPLPGCTAVAHSRHSTEQGAARSHRKGLGKGIALLWGTCNSLQTKTRIPS